MNCVDLSPASIDAVARRVIELQRSAPVVESDQWLTMEEAAKYLTVTRQTFTRWRKLYADLLKPATMQPKRWSRNALDIFKFTRGAPQLERRRGQGRVAA